MIFGNRSINSSILWGLQFIIQDIVRRYRRLWIYPVAKIDTGTGRTGNISISACLGQPLFNISHLTGGLGNTPRIEGVTCESEDVDFGNYRLGKGKLSPSSEPGFGMKLTKDY